MDAASAAATANPKTGTSRSERTPLLAGVVVPLALAAEPVAEADATVDAAADADDDISWTPVTTVVLVHDGIVTACDVKVTSAH